MNKIHSIVDECLRQHKGGEKFFDELDDILRNDTLLITMLIGKVLNYHFDYIIVSGNFGRLFKEYCIKNMPESLYSKIIVVNGGLRKGEKILEFWNEFNVENKDLVFLDDSFYLGRTRDSIKNAIEKHNGRLIKTFVFYDGSKFEDSSVDSFYNYFKNHPEDLNKPSEEY